ncbi:MAG TPA: ATP-grasp domain-containing protein [Fimbriimonadaceae bacterium]|nr:ATP-grasp domain-containing protein [Fimbriimonadaceae bacterium]
MPRLLVLALENWLGAARLPKALQCAGFEISLLCYPNTLISLTRYADDRDICLPNDPAETVLKRMLALLDAHPARMIVPADDRSHRFLCHILEVAPMARFPQALLNLVSASLPDPAALRYGNDKDAATQLMNELGFRAPRRTMIWSKCELNSFVEEAGFPVVVKPLEGTAGQGVQILQEVADLAGAVVTENQRWMVQRYIRGKAAAAASVALDGKCLGTLAFEKTITYPGETGPTSVATRLDLEEIHRAATAFAEATRYNGFYSPGFVVEEETGLPYFLEVNSRATPIVPCSGKLGLDLCEALYAGVVGTPLPEQNLDAPRMMAFYPQELHRDPNSTYRDLILDEPVDDPLVHKAMQKGIEMMAAGRV